MIAVLVFQDLRGRADSSCKVDGLFPDGRRIVGTVLMVVFRVVIG